MNSGYPFTMKHPQHAPAVLSNADVFGPYQHSSPERYADVVVNDGQQEELMRSKGYLKAGESVPVYDAKIEYPKILEHPDHVPGATATKESVVHDGKVVVVDVPAKLEKFPSKTVHSKIEEEEWALKGYFPAGHFDGEAYERAQFAPGEAGDEYPRWEKDADGNNILVDDPDRPVDESRIYPMMIYAKDGTELGVANSGAEKDKLLLARGSSKNEPARRQVPTASPTVSATDFAEWQEFQAFKAWKAAQAGGASEMVEAEPKEPETPSFRQQEEALTALRKEAMELGIAVDKRWSAKTLQAEINLALER